jgi:hypothetical protein
MRRNLLCSIIAAALLPAGSLWAAPSLGNSGYVNQIHEQVFQIQAGADGLEAYVRSGAHDWNSMAVYAADMAERGQKLLGLLDQIGAQPGATNDTRIQVEKMKSATAEMMAFAGNALGEMETRAIGLHAGNVFTDTGNIEALCNTIQRAAQGLANGR